MRRLAGIRRSCFGGRQTAIAVRTVVDVLLQKLLTRTPAEAEVFGCPWKRGLRISDREDLADDHELRAGLAVNITVAFFDGGDDVALVSGRTQVVFLWVSHGAKD
jgi:hypothetical protein